MKVESLAVAVADNLYQIAENRLYVEVLAVVVFPPFYVQPIFVVVGQILVPIAAFYLVSVAVTVESPHLVAGYVRRIPCVFVVDVVYARNSVVVAQTAVEKHRLVVLRNECIRSTFDNRQACVVVAILHYRQHNCSDALRLQRE